MTRVKRGMATKKRHKRLLKETKGYWGQRKNIIKRAKETLLRAMAYSYVGRKHKKRDMRSLFIVRINALCNEMGMSYSTFIAGLKKANVSINRKMLSQLAVYQPQVFGQLVTLAQQA
ncbi:MAG: 50S ribosomal protein L20 [Candidatus Babeliales bacterium]